MAFKKGKSGNEKTAFTKGESGNPNGRPKKLVSKVLDELKEAGEQVSKSAISDIYQVMLSLTKEQLTDLAKQEDKPIIYRILAREILGKKGFETIEKMLDRANGKPTITQEVTQDIKVDAHDLSKLTDAELRKYIELATKSKADSGGDGEA